MKRPKFFTTPFVLAVLVLGAGGVTAIPVAEYFGIKRFKERLDLKAPLAQIQEASIAPYVIKKRIRLSDVSEEALGTSEYIYWTLEDTSAPPESPLRFATFFVTYYTGGQDLVPHTPDVCYPGSGHVPAIPHENKSIEGLAPDNAALPVRVCTFKQEKPDSGSAGRTTSVVYTFKVNGEYACTREGVRYISGSLFTTHAFFSKIECSFSGINGPATREEALTQGAPKLLGVMLPILMRDHYPDFEEAERAAKAR